MKNNLERNLQIALISCFVISLLCVYTLLGIWYYDNVHEPAIASVNSGCHLIPPEGDTSGYVTVGSTTQTYNEEKQQIETKITLSPDILPYQNLLLTAVRHELCHVDQIDRGGIFAPSPCNATDGKFKRYVQEVECYIRQNFVRSDVNESAITEGDLSSVAERLDRSALPMMIP